MSTVMILSVLLAAAILSAIWFWYGCRTYEAEIVYLEDIILEVDSALNGTFLNADTGQTVRDEAALIREWREENTTTDD